MECKKKDNRQVLVHILDGRNPQLGIFRVDIEQGCSPPPPIVLIGEQEMYSGLK